MKRISLTFAVVAMAVLVAGSANAALVAVQTVVTGANTFDILIDANPGGQGDNTGLVSYGLAVEGPVLTLDHNSPNTAFAQDGGFVGGTAGFTFLRSADNALLVGASQDTITPTPHLIQGLGIVASSFAGEGLNALAPAEQPAWGAPLLIASGTFDPGQGVPSVDVESIETFVNVFGSSGIEQAEIIPEPATLILAGFGLVGVFAGRRRK